MKRRADTYAALAIALAVLAGGFARVSTVRWGEPRLLHVDELGFVMFEAAGIEYRGLTDDDWMPQTTTYGPVAYGAALLMKWAFLGGIDHARAQVARFDEPWPYLEAALHPEQEPPFDLTAWTHLCRLLSALVGALGLAAMARAAWILRGREAAVITAWIAASSVGMIQHAHYFTTDGLLLGETGFFLHACALLSRRGQLGAAIYAGVCLGVMAATKLTGIFLLAVVPFALAASAGGAGGLSPRSALARRAWLRPLGALLTARFAACALSLALTYTALCPWGVFERARYTDVPGNRSGAEVLRTQYSDHDYAFYDWRFPYNGRTHYLYELETVLPYALGGLVLLAALAGLAGAWRRGRNAERMAAAAALPTFLLVGSWGVKTIRYSMPMVPGLVLAAAFFLARAWVRGGWASRLGVGLVLASSCAWGAAYTNVLRDTDPRVAASAWLAAHAEPGDVVVVEPEEAYTVRLEPDSGLRVRRLWETQPQDQAVPAHVDALLRNARFLVIGDWYRRRGTHPEAGERAPAHARFYDAVLRGETGFELAQSFDASPRLGPLVYDERDAEALSVCFDHMSVWIYERRGDYVSPYGAAPAAPRTGP